MVFVSVFYVMYCLSYKLLVSTFLMLPCHISSITVFPISKESSVGWLFKMTVVHLCLIRL